MSGFKNADDSHNTELKVLGTGLYKLVGEPTPRGEVSIVWQLLSEYLHEHSIKRVNNTGVGISASLQKC